MVALSGCGGDGAPSAEDDVVDTVESPDGMVADSDDHDDGDVRGDAIVNPDDIGSEVAAPDVFNEVAAPDANSGDAVDPDAGNDVCQPSCLDMDCGDNGCGGSCGECADGSGCQEGKCVCVPQDRTDCCGADLCWYDSCGVVGEKVSDCEYGCADSKCAPCQAYNCVGRDCGDDGCGGTCGTCRENDSCDGKMWTPGEICMGGQCVGGDIQDCNDDNVCTQDACVTGQGCSHTAAFEGDVCGTASCDGMVWHSQPTCNAGSCEAGSTESCNDGLECTNDACSSAGGCQQTPKQGWCVISGSCWESGDPSTQNPCAVCNPAVTATTWDYLPDTTDCGAGMWCQSGACVCKPDCDGRECGDDGCGGECGPGCGYDQNCNDGECCDNHDAVQCFGDENLYWWDSCGVRQEVSEYCECGCNGQACECCKTCGACVTAAVSDGCGGTCVVNCAGVCVADSCCTPDCDGRACGDDGCGGSCGDCDGGMVCNLMSSLCVNTCDYPSGLPTTWSKTGVVNYEHIPANAAEKATCHDYTGDGVGDCGLTGLAGNLNGPLADMITEGARAVMLEFMGWDGEGDYSGFTLNGLVGVPATVGTLAGNMYVNQSAYNQDSCTAEIYFPDAVISNGHLSAGPIRMPLSFGMFGGAPMVFPLIDAYVKADVVGGSSGVSATNGSFSGILLKSDWTAILDGIDAECAKDPIPADYEDICPYMSVMRAAGAMLFDLYRNPDGTYILKDSEHPANASSWCIQFTLAKATIGGYTP